MNQGGKKWTPIEFGEGPSGAIDEKEFRAKCNSPDYVARCLSQELMWRRGKGVYAFNEDPAKNEPMPLCPQALTIVEEMAIRMLVEYDVVLKNADRMSES